jgi:crotonobetainyl-CoA:carnitine CoA-transferase CaiB-like acyl-CoA transferase
LKVAAVVGPLAGIRVVAFTQFLLGPACVQYLADMGADVITVEEPRTGAWERQWSGGGTFLNGVSVFYLLTHPNTRSLGLNLKSDHGKQIARRLLTTADVLVENFRPGVMDRLGLGYGDVHALNPRLLYASGSGYGSDGPYRDLPGQDLLLQALSGLASVTGSAEHPPTPTGSAIVDQHAAALLAIGILAALHERSKTGYGQRIELTMLDAALDLQREPLAYWMNGGLVKRPAGYVGSPYHEAPYGIYRTADGYIALSLSPIAAVSRALGNPEALKPYLTPSLALVQREEIGAALAALVEARPTGTLIPALREHGVWCAPVNDYESLMRDPGVLHLDPFIKVAHPTAGEVKLVRSPLRFAPDTSAEPTSPPLLGENTEEILKELGYNTSQIDVFVEQGAI